MTIEFIITILFLLYFIKDQFEFAKVNRLRYFLLPIGGIIVFISMIDSLKDIPLAIVLAIVAIIIGILQTKSFTCKYKYIDTNLVYKEGEVDHPITRKQLFSRGGSSYLYGWIVIVVLQVGISMFKHGFNFEELTSEFLGEILKDIFLIFRITDSDSGWWVWELYAISNIAYLFTLKNKYKDFSQTIFKKKAKD